jgi:outer membrane lipase/esterase
MGWRSRSPATRRCRPLITDAPLCGAIFNHPMLRLFKTPHLLGATLATCATLLLVACGGGTSQVDPFAPTRYVALGDELSVIASDGRKYSVNAFNAAGTALDCTLNPVWTQVVAASFGFHFKECPGTSTTAAQAEIWAGVGADAAGLKAQIDAHAAAPFAQTVLATVLVGMHDVKSIYENRGSATEAALIEQARQRGADIATQVNRLVNLGAKVVVATAPDLGLTPYALAKGTADAGLLTRLTLALNGRMRVNILNDGRYVGLVLADEMIQTAVKLPSVYGLVEGNGVTKAACSVALPDCTTSTLVTGASADSWLWADDFRLGRIAQLQVGNQAASRARNNPF